MKKNISARAAKQLKKIGGAIPAPKVSEREFAAIQKEWYGKLADDGFKDLEWVDHSTGKGQNSDFLKGSFAAGKRYHAGRDLHYRLATNYLAHCKSLRGYNRFIWAMHADGRTYQEIRTAVKRKYKRKVSIYTLYYELQRLNKNCVNWNKRYPEGLLVKWQEDAALREESIVAEFLLEYDWMLNPAYGREEW